MKDVEFIRQLNSFKKEPLGNTIFYPKDRFYELDNKFMDRVISYLSTKIPMVGAGVDEFTPLEILALHILEDSF